MGLMRSPYFFYIFREGVFIWGLKITKKFLLFNLWLAGVTQRSELNVLRSRKLSRRHGYDAIDSLIKDDVPMGCVHGGVYYLGRSLELMSWSDYIYLCDGWESARGCVVERSVAEAYGIPEVIL